MSPLRPPSMIWAAWVVGASLVGPLSVHAAAPLRSVSLGFKQVRLGDDVPQVQADVLISDLKKLSTLRFPQADPEMLRLMGFTQADPESLSLWLGSRVSYVISDQFDVDSNIQVLEAAKKYPYSTELPDTEYANELSSSGQNQQQPEETAPEARRTKPKTVMSNIGAAYYYVSKLNSAYTGLNIGGIGTVRLSSPRVGIVRIGEGLLSEGLNILRGSPRHSYAAYALRTSVYFHEARHSDGHGKSLGFMHAVCPMGHAFEGYYACDRNLNGPYTVGAYLNKAFAENCGGRCTRKDSEVLRLLTADSFDRVIRFTPTPDAEAVKTRDTHLTMLSYCNQLLDLGIDSAFGLCSPVALMNYRKNVVEITAKAKKVPSTEWESSPEFLEE